MDHPGMQQYLSECAGTTERVHDLDDVVDFEKE
jgi:hypothetical protein